jgi:hypothetical protein
MSDKAKKLLAKRGKWVKFPNPCDALFMLGGVSVQIMPWQVRGQWEMRAMGNAYIVKAATLVKAKAKALRIVQKAVLEAAEAWRD